MMRHYGLFLVACLFLIAGCATTKDLETVKEDLAKKSSAMEGKADSIEKKIASLEKAAEELAAKSKELEKGTAAIRQSEADKGADITGIRERIEELTGKIDVVQKDLTTMKNNNDKIQSRIAVIEKYLEIGQAQAASAGAADVPAASDDDAAYEAAFGLFKSEKFGEARTALENYLAQYPKAAKVPNATFWVGECFYFQGNFEKAILQYDKVVKSFPKADKVPAALFKEGMSFLKLGDRKTARILFQQVVQQYPNAPEAAAAQSRLKGLK